MSEKGGLTRLAKAIGYPQEVPAEAESFNFLVDGETISAEAEVKKLGEGEEWVLLKTVLTEDEEVAGRLATYAAGRLLKEKSVLAWDPEKRAAILWERVKRSGEGEERRAFESFCESADWWRERVKEEGSGHTNTPAVMIRP